MFRSSAYRDQKATVTRVVTALSCTATLLSVAVGEPAHRALPGTRTAVELLGKGSERNISKLALSYIALASKYS